MLPTPSTSQTHFICFNSACGVCIYIYIYLYTYRCMDTCQQHQETSQEHIFGSNLQLLKVTKHVSSLPVEDDDFLWQGKQRGGGFKKHPYLEKLSNLTNIFASGLKPRTPELHLHFKGFSDGSLMKPLGKVCRRWFFGPVLKWPRLWRSNNDMASTLSALELGKSTVFGMFFCRFYIKHIKQRCTSATFFDDIGPNPPQCPRTPQERMS